MSNARRIFHGDFGRIALLEMDSSLIVHAHSECHVLIKVSGEDTFFSVSGCQVPLTDNKVVLVNSWEPHSYEHKPGAGHTTLLALYIDPLWLSKIQKSLLLSARPDFFANCCIELKPRHRKLADYLLSEILSFGIVQKETLELLILDFLLALIDDYSEWKYLSKCNGNNLPIDFDARVQRAIKYLLLNYADSNAIEKAAEFCGLSRAHFFMLFKQNRGITPNIFLSTIRMDKSLTWLGKVPSRTLSELSEELGFSEQGHFTRFFHRHIGATPSDYRRVLENFKGDIDNPQFYSQPNHSESLE